jgi:hypothetical protein
MLFSDIILTKSREILRHCSLWGIEASENINKNNLNN